MWESRVVRPPVAAGTIWGLAWIVLRLTGQGYSLRPVYAGYQFVPADSLFDEPITAVWYLHIQPPLWNLLVGIAGGWSPFGASFTLQIVTLAIGCSLAGFLCATLVRLGAPPGWSIGLTLLGTLTTQVLLHAFEPRYDLAVAALLAALVWSTTRPADARFVVATPILVATAIAGSRTLYHPVWLIGVAALVLVAHRRALVRREVAVALAVPVLVLGGWAVKNAAVVDRPAVSTLTGMNLLRSVSPATDEAALVELTDDGEISDIWRVGLAAWALDGPCTTDPYDGNAALADPIRELPPEYRTGAFDDGEVPNYNARCFLAAYDQASDDAVTIIRRHPDAWVRGRLWAANNWFGVPSVDPAERSPLWGPWEGATRVALLGAPHPPLPSSWGAPSLWVHRTPVSLVLVALSAVVAAVGVRRSPRLWNDGPAELAPVLSGWIVVWTAAAGVLFELGEQVRFRNAIDPLVVALGGWLLVDAIRRRRLAPDPPAEP